MQQFSKTQIIVTVLLVAAIVGIAISSHHAPVPVVPAPVVTVPKVKTWPSLEVKKETISDSNQYYTIDASYPSTNDMHISDSLKSFVDDQIAQFKDDTSWATTGSTDSAAVGSLSLTIDYKEVKSMHTDTYAFDIVTYTGGAHGLEVTRTFSYDENGKLLTVADLFTNGEAGLKTVATFVQSELTKKAISDAKWIADGAGPKAENYQNFTIDDTGVTFIFDPYQVAAYSEGGQNILVPVSVFKSIANPAVFGQ